MPARPADEGSSSSSGKRQKTVAAGNSANSAVGTIARVTLQCAAAALSTHHALRCATAAPPGRWRPLIPHPTAHRSRSNFMSYRDAEINDPGTRLNCIVGPNGTGKSSIVCAMCVGLGGPLKITGRGDNIKSCVHGEGKTPDEHGKPIRSGFVETELVDGNGAGRNLVVRLDFDVDNKEMWSMDGKKVKKGEVRETMARLNIQVDNPLQVSSSPRASNLGTWPRASLAACLQRQHSGVAALTPVPRSSRAVLTPRVYGAPCERVSSCPRTRWESFRI